MYLSGTLTQGWIVTMSFFCFKIWLKFKKNNIVSKMCEICPIDNWSTVRGGGQAGWRPCLRLQCGGRLLLPLAESTLTRTTKCIFPNSKMYLYFVQNSLPPSHKKGRSSYFCCFFHADITTTPNSIPHQNKFVQIAICVRPCYK